MDEEKVIELLLSKWSEYLKFLESNAYSDVYRTFEDFMYWLKWGYVQ